MYVGSHYLHKNGVKNHSMKSIDNHNNHVFSLWFVLCYKICSSSTFVQQDETGRENFRHNHCKGSKPVRMHKILDQLLILYIIIHMVTATMAYEENNKQLCLDEQLNSVYNISPYHISAYVWTISITKYKIKSNWASLDWLISVYLLA